MDCGTCGDMKVSGKEESATAHKRQNPALRTIMKEIGSSRDKDLTVNRKKDSQKKSKRTIIKH